MGSGTAAVGLVTAVAADLAGRGRMVVCIASFAVGAGLGAIVGDALSGTRPTSEALRLCASVLVTVAAHLSLSALAHALST